MAITTLDSLAAAMAGGQDIAFLVPSYTTAAGRFTSVARVAVSSWGQIAIPAAASAGGAIPVAGNAGFPNVANAGSGLTNYASKLALVSAQPGTFILFDRLYGVSGFSGIVTTAQAITSPPTLTRAGTGVEIWLESYTAIGATAANVTVQYTDPINGAGRNTVSEAITASFPAGAMQPLRLQAGDTGVSSIQGVTLSGTTGTAGNFGIVLMRRLAMVSVSAGNVGTVADFAQLGLPALPASVALNLVNLGSTTSTGVITGDLVVAAG